MTIALALTWDGSRWPAGKLPPKARAFLLCKLRNVSVPSTRALSRLLADDQVKEIRLCWVPRLKGGREVLSEPFAAPAGRRIAFRAARTVSFGEVLGVIYQRR
jgi:hypothetical protein